MAAFDQAAFDRFIIDNDVVGFFNEPVTLKSGRKSHWYVNWRTVTEDVCLTDMVSDFLLSFVRSRGLSPASFYGVPEGATKLGIIATYKHAKESQAFGPRSHRLPMGRGKPKEHGVPKDRFFVGAPEGDVVVVEDVTTTGGSLVAELEKLKEAGVRVVAAVGLTNRMERADDGRSVEEIVKSKGVPYYSLSDATSFLPVAFKKKKPGDAVGRFIEEEFGRFGVKKIKLL
jgi:orotate phosphoribosyltransferase